MHARPLDHAQIGMPTTTQQQRSLLLSLSAADWGIKPRAQMQMQRPHPPASVTPAAVQVSTTTPRAMRV